MTGDPHLAGEKYRRQALQIQLHKLEKLERSKERGMKCSELDSDLETTRRIVDKIKGTLIL